MIIPRSLIWIAFTALILVAAVILPMYALALAFLWVAFTCALVLTWREIPFQRRPLYGKKMQIERILKGRGIHLRAIMDRGVENEEYVKYTVRWRTQQSKSNLDDVLEVLQDIVGPINRVIVESTDLRTTEMSPRAVKWKWEHEIDVIIRLMDLVIT